MGNALPETENEIAAWFQARLPASLAHHTIRATKYKDSAHHLDISLEDAKGNTLAFRFQGYDTDTKTLLKGDMALYDKSLSGLGTILLFETEEYFRQVHGFTASTIRAATDDILDYHSEGDYYNGAYVWAKYGYLPNDAEMPKLKKALTHAYVAFNQKIVSCGGRIPAEFDAKVKTLIEKLATDKTAIRDIAKLRLPLDDLFNSDGGKRDALSRIFQHPSGIANLKKYLRPHALLQKDGDIHVARLLLTSSGSWDGRLDFSDPDAMQVRENCVAAARAKLAKALEHKGFAARAHRAPA